MTGGAAGRFLQPQPAAEQIFGTPPNAPRPFGGRLVPSLRPLRQAPSAHTSRHDQPAHASRHTPPAHAPGTTNAPAAMHCGRGVRRAGGVCGRCVPGSVCRLVVPGGVCRGGLPKRAEGRDEPPAEGARGVGWRSEDLFRSGLRLQEATGGTAGHAGSIAQAPAEHSGGAAGCRGLRKVSPATSPERIRAGPEARPSAPRRRRAGACRRPCRSARHAPACG